MNESPPTSTASQTMAPTVNIPPSSKKKAKRGRKLGIKLELSSLSSHGSGGRLRNELVGESKWQWERNKSVEGMSSSDDESSSSSSYATSSDSEDDEFEYDEFESKCIKDMKGNRIVKIDRLCQVFRESICCKNCALAGAKKLLHDFITFTQEYEKSIEKEEKKQLFFGRLDKLEWHYERKKTTSELYSMFSGGNKGMPLEELVCQSFTLGEETYGFGTDLFAVCGRKIRPHSFRIDANRVSADVRKKIMVTQDILNMQ